MLLHSLHQAHHKANRMYLIYYFVFCYIPFGPCNNYLYLIWNPFSGNLFIWLYKNRQNIWDLIFLVPDSRSIKHRHFNFFVTLFGEIMILINRLILIENKVRHKPVKTRSAWKKNPSRRNLNFFARDLNFHRSDENVYLLFHISMHQFCALFLWNN